MPLYNYVAINSAGKTINVSYEAKSREDVVEKIKRENLYLVEIKEIKAHDIKMPFSLGKIKTMDIALFCRQTSTLLNAGIPLADCLEIISNQMTNKRLKLIITEISSDVQKGLPLSDAMKKQNVFPEILVNMVAAGEVSGTVDTVMTRMANSYEKDCAIQRRIKGAMVYPLILAIVAIAAVVYITTSVLPKFVEMFESGGIEMPAITKLLISISGFLISYWYLLLGCLVGIVIGVMYFLRTEFGRNLFDLLKLRIPLVSKLNIKVISVRFTRMMGSLLASGIPLIQAFEYLSIVVDNEIVKEKVLKARDEIGKGAELTEAISRMGVFEPMLINMVKIGKSPVTFKLWIIRRNRDVK